MMVNKFSSFEKDTKELRKMIMEIEDLVGTKLNTL